MSNFTIKTNEAYTIKTTIEVLQSILSDVCFNFNEDGIFLKSVDKRVPYTYIIDLQWNRDRFQEFKINDSQMIGINLQHFFKMIKSIKKKESVSLSVSPDKSNSLSICNYTDLLNPDFSSVKIQQIQMIDMDTPSGYGYPSVINTAKFGKLCKDINSISKTITVTSRGRYICFSCEMVGLYNKEFPFGEIDPESNDEEFCEEFNTKSFMQLTKISGLHQKMRIYANPGLPLKISVDTGSLGTLDIYIKSKSQVNK